MTIVAKGAFSWGAGAWLGRHMGRKKPSDCIVCSGKPRKPHFFFSQRGICRGWWQAARTHRRKKKRNFSTMVFKLFFC